MSTMRPPLETLPEHAASKYSLVVGVVTRARQLKAGQLPMVDVAGTNPVSVALEEIAAGKVLLQPEGESHIPLGERAAPPGTGAVRRDAVSCAVAVPPGGRLEDGHRRPVAGRGGPRPSPWVAQPEVPT